MADEVTTPVKRFDTFYTPVKQLDPARVEDGDPLPLLATDEFDERRY